MMPSSESRSSQYIVSEVELGNLNEGYDGHQDEMDVHTGAADSEKELQSNANLESQEEDIWKLSDVQIDVKDWAGWFWSEDGTTQMSVSRRPAVLLISITGRGSSVLAAELSTGGKVKRIFCDYLGKFLLLIVFLYLFVCSLDFLSNAFRLIGGKAAGSVFSESELLSNPVAGLMIGVLSTVILQSSSTTTTIVVSMVASKILTVELAIPIVMGANIGTSVTNTIVSIGQINNKNDFRRAFAGATVLDMFNWLSVIILLPLEAATGYLFRLTDVIVNSLSLQENDAGKQEFLKVITRPLTELIIQVDKTVLEGIAENRPEDLNRSMIKHCCSEKKVQNLKWNYTDGGNYSYTVTEEKCSEKCHFLFEYISNTWSDATVGIVLLVIALVILCACLVGIVKTLNSLLKGKLAIIIRKFINAEFPGKLAYFTGYVAIIVGTGLTILVQSSSVFTSALTPLVGVGVITIDRMYPLTLGANIGTTTTAILAALAQEADDIPISLQISFCHLFFNISGILMFYPIPFLRFPIAMAKFLGNETAKYRWFAALYLILSFFVLPAVVFGLSMISWKVMAGLLSPVAALLVVIAVVKLLQKKAPKCLPAVLRDWKFLPMPFRSLEPYDRIIGKVKDIPVCCKCNSRRKCKIEEAKNSDIGIRYLSTTV